MQKFSEINFTELLLKMASYTSGDKMFIVKRLSSRKSILEVLESLQLVIYVLLKEEKSNNLH